MYETPQGEPSGCRTTLILTRAVYAALLPAVAALLAVVIAVAVAFVLFAVHPALALLPIGAVFLAIALYAGWERSRYRPPDL